MGVERWRVTHILILPSSYVRPSLATTCDMTLYEISHRSALAAHRRHLPRVWNSSFLPLPGTLLCFNFGNLQSRIGGIPRLPFLTATLGPFSFYASTGNGAAIVAAARTEAQRG